MISTYSSICVLGAGAWGTALASILSQNVDIVKIWSRNENVLSSIAKHRTNDLYLPNIKLKENIIPTQDLHDSINATQAIILTIPSRAIEEICVKLKEINLDSNIPIVICSKGMEIDRGLIASEIVSNIIPNNIAILSGPNFAQEIASNLPGRSSISCTDFNIATNLKNALNTQNFILDINQDIIGTQIAGIIKNIVAIACGASQHLGRNAQAFIITLGFKEMHILCKKLGGDEKTLLESCGIGDLILTCNSEKSRNMSLGLRINRDQKVESHANMPEGFYAAQAVHKLTKKLNISLPLCEAVYKIISNEQTAEKALLDLFAC